MLSRRNIMFLAVTLVLAGILAYFYQQSEDVLAGPQLSVTSPVAGAAFSDSLITITGTTEHIREITVNDRAIFIDQEGRFSEPLLLQPGYNIIEVTATGRFGKQEKREVIQVVRKH